MNRPGVFVALLLSGLLALSACSSAKQAAPRSSGSTAASAIPSQTATAIPSQTASAPGETIHIGSLTLVFDTPLPTDPARAQIMKDFRKGQVLWGRSDAAHRLVAPVLDYVTADALTHLRAAIASSKAENLVPAGTDRLFKTRVTAVTARNAEVSSCEDGSRLTAEDVRTGQTMGFGPRRQAFTFETWRMVRLRGHWAITIFSLALLPDPRARQCQP